MKLLKLLRLQCENNTNNDTSLNFNKASLKGINRDLSYCRCRLINPRQFRLLGICTQAGIRQHATRGASSPQD